MSNNRLKLYYNVASIEDPVAVTTDPQLLLSAVITNGPTINPTPDRYGDNIEPNTPSSSDLVDFAITAWFVPSLIKPPAIVVPSVEEFGFFYNELALDGVPPEGAYPFDFNGPVSAGFSHVVPSEDIVILNPGTYQVVYNVTGERSNQMQLFLDSGAGPVAAVGTNYGSATNGQQNTGFAIIETTVANTILSIRNHTSAGIIVPFTLAGGSIKNNVNSLMIKSLGLAGTTPGLINVEYSDAVTGLPVDDPATVNEVRVRVSIQAFVGGAIAGTLYVQKQHSIEA